MLSKAATKRRLFFSKSTDEAESLAQQLKGDVTRLAEIVKKQQSIIVEYATREHRPENVFKAVTLDNTTSKWLERERGASCALNHDHDGTESALFNSMKNHERVKARIQENDSQGVLNWGFDVFSKIGANDSKAGAELAVQIVDLLDLYSQLPELDADKLRGAIRAMVEAIARNKTQRGVAYCVDRLRVAAICLVHVRPSGRNLPKLTCADVLGCLMATLACSLAHRGLSDDFLVRSGAPEAKQFNGVNVTAQASLSRFFQEVLPANDFCFGLPSHLFREFRQSLLCCAAAADPKHLWTVTQNLDILTLVSLDQVLGPENSNTNFTDKEMLKEILLQGIFSATAHGGAVCSPLEIAERWVRDVWSSEWVAQGALEAEQGLDVNSYAIMHETSGGDNGSTDALVALNLVDFSAAPVWVALTHSTPELAEPMGHLFINRGHWANKLKESRHVSPDLKAVVVRRSGAFESAFADIAYEPKTKNTLVCIEPQQHASRDFLHYQEAAFRSTGSAAAFLAILSGTKMLRETHAKVSLAQSVGLLEVEEHIAPQATSGKGRNAAIAAPPSPKGRRGQTAQVTPLDMVPFDAANDKIGEAVEGNNGTIGSIGSLSSLEEKNGSTLMIGLPKNPLKRAQSKAGDTKQQSCKVKTENWLRRILNHPVTYPFLTYLTIFALFGDDIKLAAFDKSSDQFFGWITLVTFLCFLLEMTCKIVVEANYMSGFFFWLDLVATISLIPDIPVVWDALVAGFESVLGNEEQNGLSLTRATRASRAGARAARIVRILRLVRLIRIFKLYEFIQIREARLASGKRRGSVSNNVNAARYMIKRRMSVTQRNNKSINFAKQGKKDLDPSGQPQSKVGAKLADLTTRRVIIVVLTILFILPLINIEEEDYSLDASLGMLHAASVQLYLGHITWANFNETLGSFVMGAPKLLVLELTAVEQKMNLTSPIVGSKIPGTDTYLEEDVFRTAEVRKAVQYCAHVTDENPTAVTELTFCAATNPSVYDLTSYASVNNQDWEQVSAVRSIIQTLFIILVFGIATMLFTFDAHKLVIAPIEKMVRIVEALADNPLTQFDDDDGPSKNESEMLMQARKRVNKKKEDAAAEGYETNLLENCIKKIGGLLQVGFGEAGAEIIASNMNGSGLLDPMVPGRKVQAVFGFCDIRNFMSTTEVLGEEVLLYVNEIANIVHTQVAKHSGNANRNMGDSFLLVWKRSTTVADDWETLAEKALISFLKITVDLHRNAALEQYNDKRHAIGGRLRQLIPNFKVQLGFGLHLGWAIEGAIGSNCKIDASYLSPHVNLASRLEEYTRSYGISLLMSGDFYEILGSSAKRCCRVVDRVVLKGLHTPTSIYTYDCNTDNIKVKLESAGLKTEDVVRTDMGDRRISLIGPAPMIDHNRELVILEECPFQTDLELRALQWELPPHFIPVCRKGVSVYLAGKWGEAKTLLEAAIRLHPAERKGPCANILTFMESYGYQAPDDWKGYRTKR